MKQKEGEAKMPRLTKEIREKNRMETLEFIGILLWYIKTMQETTRDFIKAQNDINEVFNERIKPYRPPEEEKPADNDREEEKPML